MQWQNLLDKMAAIPAIDTHEHMPARDSLRDSAHDILSEYLLCYFDKDLCAAGCPQAALEAARRPGGDIRARFMALWPYWRVARHTGYGRALSRTALALYGMDFSPDTIEALSRAHDNARGEGHYARVAKMAGVSRCVLDSHVGYGPGDWYDRTLFVPVYRLDEWVMPTSAWMDRVEKTQGVRLYTLEDYVRAMRAALLGAAEDGFAGYKLATAYFRPLTFDFVPAYRAQQDYLDALRLRVSPGWDFELQVTPQLQDYLLHEALRVVEQTGLTLQVHTGILESNGADFTNADATRLIPLLNTYTGIRFDIFHINYPNWQPLSALAKGYPNVYLDLCWANSLSPVMARWAMREWLSSVPYNKISGFGGDSFFIDGIVGHASLARENIARALCLAMDDSGEGEDWALEVATAWLQDNPARLFGIG
nr:amidohydrolase family protein [bacterium]